MLAAKLVFVDVDTQVDFISPTGKLSVPRAGEIVENLRRLTEYAHGHGIPIIATACAHDDGDAEFQVFPPHCLRGTPGQRRIAETEHPGAPLIGAELDEQAAAKFERAGAVVLEKKAYDVFSNPNAPPVFAAAPDAEFVVYGLAIDYCVKAVVLGLRDRGREVVVVSDAVRPVDARQGAAAIEEFRRRHVRFTATDEVCSRS
jgi:nicotinamidase/pyrazinamidase